MSTRKKTLALVLTAAATAALAASPARAQDAPEKTDDAAGETRAPWDYPRDVEVSGVRLAFQEPSVLDYTADDGAVSMRVPVMVTDSVGRITWGSLDLTGTAHLDLSSRLAAVDGLAATSTAFPGLDDALATATVEALPNKLPAEILIRLELITDRPGAAPVEDAVTGSVSKRPPEVHVRRTPAMLVQIDGEPEMGQVESFPLEYVLNCATDIFHELRDDRWLMLVDGFWASSPKLEGPWEWFDGKLPVVLTQLPVDHPRGHVRRYVPGTRRYNNRVGKTPPTRPESLPEIIISEKPAELVRLLGDPLFTLVPGVKLMIVANTASDLLFHPRTGKYFLLISGRWFTADEVDGPWEQHYGALPDEFKGIPTDHSRAHVLYSVPGTPQSAEAAARALLPERVLLHRRINASIKYEKGTIISSPIEKVDYRIVTSTEDAEFEMADGYYACVRGAWFRSDTGKGQWKIVEELPEALKSVPESTGAYHVSWCIPRGAQEKGFVFETRGPYRGVYLNKGTPVHGNGWDRRGILRNGNWYPAQRTYGENRWYDPLAATFRPRSVLYGDDGQATATEWSDYTGSYGRVRWYADRYLQGGRRMFPYLIDADAFDTKAPRPDINATWSENVIGRDGLAAERFPLGDRSNEISPASPPIVSDTDGNVFQLTDAGVEKWKDGDWAVTAAAAPEIKTRLEALARVQGFADAARAWAAKRAGALPVNPVVTPPMKKKK
jgi:hypothetical protein